MVAHPASAAVAIRSAKSLTRVSPISTCLTETARCLGLLQAKWLARYGRIVMTVVVTAVLVHTEVSDRSCRRRQVPPMIARDTDPKGALMKHLCSALVQLAIIMSATIATSTPPILTATLKEQWRLTESDDSPLIGDIIDAATDAAGNTYLLDFKLQTVIVIDPSGALLRTIGGPGDGPGETRMPSRIFLEPDGRVGLLDAMSPRLVWFNAAGLPASGGPPSPERRRQRCLGDRLRLAVCGRLCGGVHGA